MKRVHFVLTLAMLVGTLAWAQANPVPFIDQPLVPMTVAPGSAGFTLTVNGAGFVAASLVQWNGVALPTTYVSGIQLTAAVPAANVAKAETASVTVFNPPPGGGTSLVSFFQVVTPLQYLAFSQSEVSQIFPEGIAVGDFNRDGNLDLAEVFYSSSIPQLSIFLGNGDGTFRSAATYSLAACHNSASVFALATGDFNGDGNLDLVLGCSTDEGTSILLGNGDGTFQAPQQASTDELLCPAAGDVNGDGKLDVVGVGTSTNMVQVLPGNGDGTFQPPLTSPITSYDCTSLVLADFNSDGKLDVAVGSFGPGEHGILGLGAYVVALGNGDGTFTGSAGNAFSEVGGFYMTAAELTGDGNPDLLFSFGGDVWTLLGNGDGTFQDNPVITASEALGPEFIGDFNGDGEPDALVGNTVLLGNGDGTFQSYQPGTPIYVVPSPIAGDFNGDGRLDALGSGIPPGFVIALQIVAPLATVAPLKLTFSVPQAIGTTSPAQIVTLTNSGNATMSISSISMTGADAGDFGESNNCGKSLPAQATCKINVTFMPAGGGGRTASLSISDNASGSPQAVSLAGTAEDFSISPASPTSVTVAPGQAANYSVSIAPINGFNQKIALTCSGLPTDSTCTLTPSSVTLNGTGSANVAVAVVTTGSAVGAAKRGKRVMGYSFGFALLAPLAMIVCRRRTRRLGSVSLVVLFLTSLIMMSGCGGGGSGGNGGSGTPTGTYNIVVTGTYTAGTDQLVHDLKLTLVVQ